MRGSGDSDGLLHDEYTAAGAGRRARGDRLARGAALVQRRGRHDGNLLGRLQRAAGRRAPAAGAEGDHHRLLDRRPLRRRRPLHGRRAARPPISAGARSSSASMCRPPDPAIVGERWRDDVAGAAARTLPLFVENWLAAPAPRRVLEARLGRARTTPRSSARSTPSAAGPTATPTPSRACSQDLTVPRKGLIGPWAHAYPHFGTARPADRLPAGDAALVGPLAEGHRHRHDGRADAARLDDGQRQAGAYHEALPGRWIAEASWPPPGITPRRLFLTDEGLRDGAGALTARALCSPLTVGTSSGNWVPVRSGA